MSREPLDVWLYGTRIATVRESAPERIALEWTPEAGQRWGRGARLLSAKLAIGTRAPDPLVRVYLDGLLPEGNARVNAAISAGVPPDDTYALVRAYGRDTPGAAIFVSAGSPDPSRRGRYEPITIEQVAHRLRRADQHLPATPGELGESSTLPGMVPKITVHREGDQWFACKAGAPSTWILKRGGQSGVHGDIIDTEVACLALARQIGLTTIAAEIVELGEQRAIAVSRYDRTPERSRLHQEDLAQALGLNTSDPNRKFQWGGRLPTLAQAAAVLRLDGGNPDALLRLATFSFLVGNTDMHAKNISFLRHDDGRVELAPAYDVAMHLHHGREDRRSALDVNRKFRMDALTIADVIEEGKAWDLPDVRAKRVVATTTQDVLTALGDIDRIQHPDVPPIAWDILEDRTTKAVQALKDRGGPKKPQLPKAAEPAPETEGALPQRRRGPNRPR